MSSGTRQVRLRSELEHSRQQHQGKTYLVVKDPITRRYFRFTESQAVILEMMMDTPVDAETIATRVSERLHATVSPATISAFFDSLESKYLIDDPSIHDKLNAIKGTQLEDSGMLYWKIASLDPARLFRWLSPRTAFAFKPAFHIFAVLTILTGFTLSYLNWDRMVAGTGALFSVQGLFLIWLTIFTVTTIHEFSHGLTCTHFGGTVHEVGFMLIYFQPAFYCDVSDSWMFPSKKHRMYVTLAGGYIQLVIWGLCTMVWRVTDTDTFVNQLALIVVLFSGLQTLVNFNPLIKLDGYYMLSDYLEIPNLRTKALTSLWDWVAGREKRSWRDVRPQVIYGAASMVFSTTLLVAVYLALYTWSTSSFATAGLIGFLMFSTFTLRKSTAEHVAGFRAFAARAAVKKYRNIGIGVAALLVMFLGHWELKIPADFKILARNEMVTRAQTPGVIVEMLVQEGSTVQKGDVLARLRDFEKQEQITGIEGDLNRKRSELALVRAGTRPEEIDRAERLVETRQVALANATRNQEQRNQLQQTLERKKSELQLDQQNLNRARELDAGGLIPRQELERYQTAVTVREREIDEIEASIRVVTETAGRDESLRERELAEAQSALRLMRAGSRPEVIQQLQADVAKLESQHLLLEQEIEKTEIRSPIDGVVVTPFVQRRVNQFLASGDELARIVDTSRVTAEMLVPEKELADVRPGNPIWMKLRSFPTVDIQGRVDFIAPVAQTVDTQQMVVVRSELPNDDQLLKPEMTGVAKIYSGQRRIIDLVTRRFRRWIRTEFLHLLP